jgi:hypothetical protein
MAYEKQTWNNGAPPHINATGLTHIENGIFAAAAKADAAQVAADLDDDTAALVGDSGTATGAALTATIVSDTFRQRPVSLNSAPQGARREYPTLVKSPDAPILTFAEQGANSIYWPWIVDRWDGDPSVPASERFALYYSTDHAPHANSGIRMFTGPNPWTWTTDLGRVYRDDTGGTQTETPCVFWNEVTEEWMMFHQQAGVGTGDQSTLLAVSADGITWTKVGIVAQQEAAQPGVGHMGYFRPFRIGSDWVAFSLAGADGWQTSWYSEDGYTWEKDARLLPRRVEKLTHIVGYVEDDTWGITNHTSVLTWNGAIWQIAMVGQYSPGGVVYEKRFVTAEMTDDFRDWKSRPVDVTPAHTWETDSIDGFGSPVMYDSDLYIPYRADGSSGSFGLVKVV